jgi:hypothetical protein
MIDTADVISITRKNLKKLGILDESAGIAAKYSTIRWLWQD